MLVDEEAQPLQVKLNDATTGINSIDNSQLTIDNARGNIYSLDGRKVADGSLPTGKLPKGVYIINGKKVVIK
jgi:hypothetical protein